MIYSYFKNLFLGLSICSFGLLVSCSSENTSADGNEGTELEEEVVMMEDEEDFSYSLPSALQIATIFKKAGLTYMADITNPPANKDNYTTKHIQKLNFGIYSADLAYCVLNNQNQQAINYMKTIGELSQDLWMTNIFASTSILQRFEKNFGNEDSLINIIADFQMELDNYLDENGLSENSVIIFTGAWIESMYIGSKVHSSSSSERLSARLSEQHILVETLAAILESYKSEKPELSDLYENIMRIKALFKVQETEDGFTMNAKDIQALSAEIEKVRNSIIQQ